MIIIKNQKAIKKMRVAGKLAAKTLNHVAPFVKEGVSTEKLNQICEKFIEEHHAIAAPLNYHGFPKSICTSINNVVCHGIPSENEILKNGDIVNIDITVIKKGYHGDTSRTFIIGEVDENVKKFVERTKKSLYIGIDAVKPGANLNEIGIAIENYISQFGYSIVGDYGGHGIGKSFHEDPQVFHHDTGRSHVKLRKGMTFTIEPMINMGSDFNIETSEEDNWTVTTKDKSLSAQFEHTILVTKDGCEILTKDPDEN